MLSPSATMFFMDSVVQRARFKGVHGMRSVPVGAVGTLHLFIARFSPLVKRKAPFIG